MSQLPQLKYHMMDLNRWACLRGLVMMVRRGAIRRLEGRVEGRLEGRLEGRVEGRVEGRLEGRVTN